MGQLEEASRNTGHPLLFQSLSTPDQDPQRQDCKTHNKEWVFKCADYASSEGKNHKEDVKLESVMWVRHGFILLSQRLVPMIVIE